jgi:hypothetical protein
MGAAPDDAEDLATQGCHGSLGTSRMSYALKMFARSPTNEPPPRAQTLGAARGLPFSRPALAWRHRRAYRSSGGPERSTRR